MNSHPRITKRKTPYYVSASSPAARRQVAAVVKRLAPGHPELRTDGDFLWSAAAYLLADGQPLNDGRVLEEARRRKAYFNACMAHNRTLRERWAAKRADAEAARAGEAA